MHELDRNPPLSWIETTGPISPSGITLRDLFAAFALAGLSSATDSCGTWMGDANSPTAKAAYELADAMLQERALEAERLAQTHEKETA